MAIPSACGAQVMEEEQDTPSTLPIRKLDGQDRESLYYLLICSQSWYRAYVHRKLEYRKPRLPKP